MDVVGGHRLLLVFDEAEGWELKASSLAVSILNHVCELILRAGDKQVEDARVGWQRGNGGIASVQQDIILACEVGGLDFNIHIGPQFNSPLWDYQWLGVVGITKQLHAQGADETAIVVLDYDRGG